MSRPPETNDIKILANQFIQGKERFYKKSISTFSKYLIEEFADFMTTKTISVDKVKPSFVPRVPGTPIKVAMIMQSVGYFTGGRYYAWFIAMAMVELGFDVTVYTDRESGFYSDVVKYYKQPKVEIIVKSAAELQTLDVEADMYIGVPVYGSVAAIALGKRYNKPTFVMVFDPFPMMEKYLGYSYDGWDELKDLIYKNDVKIISLCQSTSVWIYEWLNKRKDQVFEIYPCINNREKEQVRTTEPTEDYVIFISRLVPHKKFEHVLDAVKDTGMKLKVVSSVDSATMRAEIAKRGMKDQVDLCLRCSDQEKFDLIYGAKAMINGAIFEGFGVWATEAISCGIPLVCYDFPTLSEIKEFAKAKNVYLAKWNEPEDLGLKLKQALKEAKFTKGTNVFDFEAMIKRVQEVFSVEPKIGVVTIALNEAQFINASLKSVIRHPNVKKVAVVEGAVNLFAHAATPDGLSLDNTSLRVIDAMEAENGHKIIYDRYGWAAEKSELRNRALELIGPGVDYILVVDADEIWSQDDLDALVQAMKDNFSAGVLAFPFYHFFKNADQVAVGGQWDSYLFRCFKFEDKALRWNQHQLPVVHANGQSIQDTDGIVRLDHIHVYHLGYLKDDQRIMDKLEYYSKRDGYLKVNTNWKDWKEGDPTSFTHHNGEIARFEGIYPEEMQTLL